MDKFQRDTYLLPLIDSTPFDMNEGPEEFQNPMHWKKQKLERGPKNRPIKEAKLMYTSTTVSRKSKNINRSPRQVRRNERERGRKARLNAAFKVLRNVIPFYSEGLNKEKLTQVQVLRLASKYIMTLSDILGSESFENDDEVYSQQFLEYQNNYDVVSFAAPQ